MKCGEVGLQRARERVVPGLELVRRFGRHLRRRLQRAAELENAAELGLVDAGHVRARDLDVHLAEADARVDGLRLSRRTSVSKSPVSPVRKNQRW